MNLTAKQIINAVMRDRWRRNFCLPNYTPMDWWECDVFEVTAAGYFREYEIKLTRGDFFADARKAKKVWVTETVPEGERQNPWHTVRHFQRAGDLKHELLASSSERGPTRFWYVTPTGLVVASELPRWAGLIEVQQQDRWLTLTESIEAPKLHKKKVADDVMKFARSTCYYRFHELRTAVGVAS